MNPQSRAPEQALTVLAISTVVVGFGLFGGDFFAGAILSDSPANGKGLAIWLLGAGKLGCALAVFIHYGFVLASTKGIVMRDNETTGKDVADGPLAHLLWLIGYVVAIFVFNVIKEFLGD